MDRDMYMSRSDVVRFTTIKIFACMRAAYRKWLLDVQFDVKDAFQATRLDKPMDDGRVSNRDGTAKSERLFCMQPPGFIETIDGEPAVAEVLVSLQGRIDAARLFSGAFEKLLVKCGCRVLTWDPRCYVLHTGPLAGTAEDLEKVLVACKDKPNVNGVPVGFFAFGMHVDDGIGVASSIKMVEYVSHACLVAYVLDYSGWQKVLGFKADIDDDMGTVTLSAPAVIQALADRFLKEDVKLVPQHIASPALAKLERVKEPPTPGSPEHACFLQTTADVRAMVGVFMWLMQVYDKMVWPCNTLAGLVAAPPLEAAVHCKRVIMHMVAYDEPPCYGGKLCTSLQLADPTVPPFTDGKVEFGLIQFCDAGSSGEVGITASKIMLAGATIETLMQRQHLTAPESHTIELVAAGTALHRIIPVRGLLQELHILQDRPTPLYMDSQSALYVALDRAAVKKSVWLRRRASMLQEGVEQLEIDPRKVAGEDNLADNETKYKTYGEWRRLVNASNNLSAGDGAGPSHKPVKDEAPSPPPPATAKLAAVTAVRGKKKGVIEEWAESLTVPQAQEILDRYEYADMQCLLHGPSDEWEVDASHAASRGPALRKRIERGALI